MGYKKMKENLGFAPVKSAMLVFYEEFYGLNPRGIGFAFNPDEIINNISLGRQGRLN